MLCAKQAQHADVYLHCRWLSAVLTGPPAPNPAESDRVPAKISEGMQPTGQSLPIHVRVEWRLEYPHIYYAKTGV